MQFSIAHAGDGNGDIVYFVYPGELPLGEWRIEAWDESDCVCFFDLNFLFPGQYFPIYVPEWCTFWKVRDAEGELVRSGVFPSLTPRQAPLRIHLPPQGNSMGGEEGWILNTSHSEWNLLIRPGLEKFPRIQLVDDGDLAHLVVHHFVGMERDATPPNPRWKARSIMLDYGDFSWLNFFSWFPLYFKRSWVWKDPERRIEMGFDGIPHVLPLHYCVKECQGETGFDLPDRERDLDVVCHFVPDAFGEPRERVAFHVSKLLSEGYSGHVGLSRDYEWPSSYGGLTREYFSQMKRAKVVVCCNPECWEGDFRLYEAVTSGAVVFCDRMFKVPPELEDVVEWYDLEDLEGVLTRIKEVLADPKEWKRKSATLQARALNSCLPEHLVERIIRASGSLLPEVDLDWVFGN